MKFYKFKNGDYSYYALIGSNSEGEAKEFYEENVADIEGEQKDSKPIELTKDGAFKEVIGYYKVKGELDIDDTQSRFNKAIKDGENTLFAVDRNLY